MDKDILLLNFEILNEIKNSRLSKKLTIVPPISIAYLSSYLNSNTKYKSNTLDIGAIFSKKIIEINKKLNIPNLILSSKQIETLITLTKDEIITKLKKISIEKIQKNKDPISTNLLLLKNLIYNLKLEKYSSIGISIQVISSLKYSLLLTKLIKSLYPGVKIIFGGSIFNENSLEILKYNLIDFLTIGKGYDSLEYILDKINNKKSNLKAISGKIYYLENNQIKQIQLPILNNKKNNLDLLPDFSYFRKDLYDFFNFETGIPLNFQTGCIYNCSYCSWNSFSKNLECSDSKTVINNIQKLKKKYNISKFSFMISSINIHSSFLEDFYINMIKQNLDIEYITLANINNFTEKTAIQLSKTGCKILWFGLENINSEILNLMNKPKYPENYEKVFKICKKYNIKTIACYIVGFPGETENTIKNAKDFIQKNYKIIDDFAIFEFALMPGSKIFNNKEKYNIKNIFVAESKFKIPFEYGYNTKTEDWKKIKKNKSKWLTELEELCDQLYSKNFINTYENK